MIGAITWSRACVDIERPLAASSGAVGDRLQLFAGEAAAL